MQEAAKDLLNAEDDVMEDGQGEERSKEEVPVFKDEDFSDERREGAEPFREDTEEGGGGKQDRDLRVGFKEPVGVTGVGEDDGMILNGDEQGDDWAEEVGGGVGRQCVGLGLKAKGTGVDVPKMRVLVVDPETDTSGFLEMTKHKC